MKVSVKEHRQKLGISQEELAKRSGISRQTISTIENGNADGVMVRTLVSLAETLGTTVDRLFFDDGVKHV